MEDEKAEKHNPRVRSQKKNFIRRSVVGGPKMSISRRSQVRRSDVFYETIKSKCLQG